MKGGEATTVEVAEYGPTERVTRRPRLRRGGAIAGPVGTFLALPTAALISPFVPDYAQTYDVAYRPTYHDETQVDPKIVRNNDRHRRDQSCRRTGRDPARSAGQGAGHAPADRSHR